MADVALRGDLPDVNVWLALVNEQHVHHNAAVDYWNRVAAGRVFLCRITMLGLLRLSTNRSVMGGTPFTVGQAWDALQRIVDLPEIGFQGESDGLDATLRRFSQLDGFRSADWTDAYLAALASQAHLRMVSFDRGFARYHGLSSLTLAAKIS